MLLSYFCSTTHSWGFVMRKVVTLRLEEQVVEGLRAMGESDGRSLANLIELWWRRERDRRLHGEVTLDDVLDRLERIQDALAVKKKSGVGRKSPLEVALFEGLNMDAWKSWVEHRRQLGCPMSYGEAEKVVAQLAEWDEQGWAVEKIIEHCIHEISRKLYLPHTFIRSVKGKASL